MKKKNKIKCKDYAEKLVLVEGNLSPDKTDSICQRLAIAVDRIEAQLLRLENF